MTGRALLATTWVLGLACGGTFGPEAGPALPAPCATPRIATLDDDAVLVVCDRFAALSEGGPWTELPVPPGTVQGLAAVPGGGALLVGKPFARWEAGNSSWEEVTPPDGLNGAPRVVRAGEGLLLVAEGACAVQDEREVCSDALAWWSADGESWTAVDSPPAVADPRALGATSDGRVLLAGAPRDLVYTSPDRTAWFDVSTKTWLAGPAIEPPREVGLVASGASVVRLGNFTPRSGHDGPFFEVVSAREVRPFQAASLDARIGAATVALPDGRVLIAGGGPGPEAPASSETWVFDPSTGDTVAGAPMASARTGAAAASRPDGSVWIVGGQDSSGLAVATVDVLRP